MFRIKNLSDNTLKSTLLSGILLYMLVADGEGGAECYTVATKRDQARITFNEAVNMIRQSPNLSKHLKKRKTDIYFPVTFGKIEALASDSNSLDGLNSHCVVIDELHAIKDRNLYEVMKQSMSARRQPLLVMITTAGSVRSSIYDDMYEYATKVADGSIKDDRFLPILYELDERREWTDYKCWMKANPGLGPIKKLDDLTEKVARAKENSRDLPGILMKDFNMRETVSSAWLNYETINNEATFDIDDLRGSYALAGTDLSSTTDLTCASILVVKNNIKYVIQQYFMPSENLQEKMQTDKVPYDKWVDQGYITLCEGVRVNYSDVTEWYKKMRDEYELYILWSGYDAWNANYWVEEMQSENFVMEKVIQGPKTMSSPMKEMAADLAEKKINYGNNPVLKWCLTNTVVKVDTNDNISPIKGRNQRQRIDGTVALIDSLVVYQNHREDYHNLID